MTNERMTDSLFDALDTAGIYDGYRRRQAAFYVLGYLAPNIDPELWQEAVDAAIADARR